MDSYSKILKRNSSINVPESITKSLGKASVDISAQREETSHGSAPDKSYKGFMAAEREGRFPQDKLSSKLSKRQDQDTYA